MFADLARAQDPAERQWPMTEMVLLHRYGTPMAFDEPLLAKVRERFYHVDECPIQGPRAYLENAGGSLTLKTAVERTAELMTIPDNQGRSNVASKYLGEIIAQGRDDMMAFFGASTGTVFMGETATELLTRVIRNAIFASPGSLVVGSHLEHPATYSACRHWAPRAGKTYEQVDFDPVTTVVGADQYRPAITPDLGVATIIQASPITGMHVDVEAIVGEIRAVAPECFIIVDGVQHAAHGSVDVDAYGADAYVIAGYKLYSRHNFGVAWVSDRLHAAPHEQIAGAPGNVWKLGTRDASAFAAFSEIVRYFEWLGTQVTDPGSELSQRQLLEHAGAAIRDQEHDLVNAIIWGTGEQPGLGQSDAIRILGPATSDDRSGMVSFSIAGHDSGDVVDILNAGGIRTHARRQDYQSNGVLVPLGVETCVRVSSSHYNSLAEIEKMLSIVNRIASS